MKKPSIFSIQYNNEYPHTCDRATLASNFRAWREAGALIEYQGAGRYYIVDRNDRVRVSIVA